MNRRRHPREADHANYMALIGRAREFRNNLHRTINDDQRSQSLVARSLSRVSPAVQTVQAGQVRQACGLIRRACTLTCSPALQMSLTAGARLLLGGDANRADAEALAGQAVELYRAEPPERQQLGLLCLARLNLADAQLTGDNLEGAVANIGDTLTIIAQRPAELVTRRLTQIANTLQRPRYQNTALALDLRDQIHTATTPAPPPRLEP
jgi:hypothetical protein